MGYTRYWYRPKELNKLDFAKLRDTIETIINNVTDIDIVDSFGEGFDAELTNEHISFNGLGDEGHESFHLPRILGDSKYYTECTDAQHLSRGLYFQFCKTQRKPYDDVVAAALLALKEIFPECEVSSDGIDDFTMGAILLSDAKDIINGDNPPDDKLNQLKESLKREQSVINKILDSAPPEYLPYFLKGIVTGYNEALKRIENLRNV
jgi:hypothetical protein